MNGCWITLSARDVYVIHPLGVFDNDLELLFKTEEAIDSAIEQLEKYKADLRNGVVPTSRKLHSL